MVVVGVMVVVDVSVLVYVVVLVDGLVNFEKNYADYLFHNNLT